MGKAVMSIIVRIPDPETGELSRIELSSNLEAVCLDHDMEQDDMLTFMTGQRSFFREFIDQWTAYPVSTICQANIIPLTNLGILSCELALQACQVHITSNNSVPCGDQAIKLIWMCRKQWGRRRYEFSRINHARQDLTMCWNKLANETRRKPQSRPSFGDQQFYNLALDCATFVTEFQQMLEAKEGYPEPPRNPCEIAKKARHLIACNILDPSDPSYFFPSFSEALSNRSPGLLRALQQFEVMQGSFAIEVLEKLP